MGILLILRRLEGVTNAGLKLPKTVTLHVKRADPPNETQKGLLDHITYRSGYMRLTHTYSTLGGHEGSTWRLVPYFTGKFFFPVFFSSLHHNPSLDLE